MSKSNRRKFIATGATLAAGTLAASAITPLNMQEINYPIVHHVFFWLKNPSSVEDRNKIIDGLSKLRAIKAIKAIHIGVVASTEKRDVVENSWSVSELMFFDNLEDQKIYQDHPIHQEFIKNCSGLWSKVMVFDAAKV